MRMHDYARANVLHHTAAQAAENQNLRRDIERSWKDATMLKPKGVQS